MLGQTKLICCCSDFWNKKLERAIEKKKKKRAIKWEWLETIIELLHGFGLEENLRHTVYYDTSDKRAFHAYLALHFMMREEKILVLCRYLADSLFISY